MRDILEHSQLEAQVGKGDSMKSPREHHHPIPVCLDHPGHLVLLSKSTTGET
jgi:hypothetical protein